MFERRETERAGPGVVDQSHRALIVGNCRKQRDVAHLHRQTAGAFKPDRAGLAAKLLGVIVKVERVEKSAFDSHPFEQPCRHAARGIVAIVRHQQHIAGLQHREQGARNRRHAAGIKHRAMRARLDLCQSLGQRPLRRRAASAVEEMAIGVGLARRLALGLAGVEVGRGTPDRGVDHSPGPFLAPPGLSDLGAGFHRLVAAATHAGPCSFGVSGSALQSTQLPS